jgi:cell division protein FtsW
VQHLGGFAGRRKEAARFHRRRHGVPLSLPGGELSENRAMARGRFYCFSMLLILYTVLPGVPRSGFGSSVPVINGAHPWIKFGPFSLQPSELMKIAFVMVAGAIPEIPQQLSHVQRALAPVRAGAGPRCADHEAAGSRHRADIHPCTICDVVRRRRETLASPGGARHGDRSGADHVDGRTRRRGPGSAGLQISPGAGQAVQRERVKSMFNNDPKTQREKGYQQRHALIAFGSGGVLGKGSATSRRPMVPESHNDMNLRADREQFGLIGSIAVL